MLVLIGQGTVELVCWASSFFTQGKTAFQYWCCLGFYCKKSFMSYMHISSPKIAFQFPGLLSQPVCILLHVFTYPLHVPRESWGLCQADSRLSLLLGTWKGSFTCHYMDFYSTGIFPFFFFFCKKVMIVCISVVEGENPWEKEISQILQITLSSCSSQKKMFFLKRGTSVILSSLHPSCTPLLA